MMNDVGGWMGGWGGWGGGGMWVIGVGVLVLLALIVGRMSRK